MADELIWHVNENDQPIGSISRAESRKIGARYRMVRIQVESPDGESVLLQKRLSTKKTYPGCWDTSAGGNIQYGESYGDAAERELSEEIGLSGVEFREIGMYYSEAIDPDGNKMNRFTKVYKVIADMDTKFTPQDTEVESVQWIDKNELAEVIKQGNVTDGLEQVFNRYYRNQ